MQGLFDTVADELGRMDGTEAGKPQATEPLVPAVLPDTPPLPAPGIYFGVPEEQYHAWPALSSHGVKELLASPMLFWARRGWLSERRRKEEAEQAAEPSERIHRTIGKAYHCRILEGADEYARRFACELTPEECEGALESTDEIKGALAALGIKPWGKVPDELPDGTPYERAARKEDWTRQLLAQNPDAKILSVLRQQHAQANAGKAFIPADAHEQIAVAAKMVEADAEIRHAFRGGYPEVSLVWHCAETGVPMKARVDYLKLKAAVDLKSIKFEGGMSIERALARAIASYHYNFQPAVYVEGIQAVRALLREGKGFWGLPQDDRDIDVAVKGLEWANKWAAETDDPKWLFVFQAKGEAPITRACFYPLAGTTHMITCDMVKTAKRRFRQFSETFGVEPWLDVQPIYDLSDEDVPSWSTDI